MTRPRSGRASDERGVSIVETVTGILILTTTVLSLVATTGWANRATVTARRDLQWWSALQWKADSLMAVDSASAGDGTDVVNGYPLSWTVTRGAATRVDIVIRGTSILNDAAIADTLSVYLGS